MEVYSNSQLYNPHAIMIKFMNSYKFCTEPASGRLLQNLGAYVPNYMGSCHKQTIITSLPIVYACKHSHNVLVRKMTGYGHGNWNFS